MTADSKVVDISNVITYDLSISYDYIKLYNKICFVLIVVNECSSVVLACIKFYTFP